MGKKIQITEADIFYMVEGIQRKLYEYYHDDEDFSPDPDDTYEIDFNNIAASIAVEYYLQNPEECIKVFIPRYNPKYRGQDIIALFKGDKEGYIEEAVTEADIFKKLPCDTANIDRYDSVTRSSDRDIPDSHDTSYSSADYEVKQNTLYIQSLELPDGLKQAIFDSWQEAIQDPESAHTLYKF